MSSLDPRFVRLGLAFGLALLVAGCFRPVYGDMSTPGVLAKDGGGGDVAAALKTVEVKPIEGRVGGKMRNELIFMLRGGAGPGAVAYRLEVRSINEIGQSAVVDPLTDVQETRTISLAVQYVLTRAGSIDPLFTGNALATATYFAGLQRFANVRAERDAEDRAATQIAERIRARLVSYFATGK
ncbi:LPS assembly lipoprotein LptE [Hansschlegelia beijingensis]|uniref:LPS assembly lipoprotein LptE n=1 Tax=Hansschlegelia beijingensis TaxID=1133344 RepID=UPI0037F31285